MAHSLSSNKGQSYFQKSLQALQKKAPLLKTLLLFEKFQTEQNNCSLFEAQKLKDFLKNCGAQTLFLFGQTFQPCVMTLLSWLQEDQLRHIFLVSDKLQSFQALFQSQEGTQASCHSQIDFLYLNSPAFWQQNKKQILSHLGRPFKIYNISKDAFEFQKFKDQVVELSIDQNIVFAEYLFTSPIFYENVFQNLDALAHSYSILGLKNSFLNTPAFICAAGPSINLELELLKKVSQKGLLFASGRTLSILGQAGVEPHFAVGVDPYEMHHDTFSQNLFFQTPLIYRLRMHHKALEKAHGEILYCPGATGYPLIQWLEKQFKIVSREFDEGLNAVNFAVHLASFMGCNPIVLVGADLAYQHQLAYSDQALVNQKLPESGALDEEDYSMHRGYWMKNHQDKPLYTLWKWKEEAKWLSNFAQKHPEKKYYNTTIEGLPIEHFQFTSLKDLISTMQIQNIDFHGRLHQTIQNLTPFNIPSQSIQALKNSAQNSLKECLRILNERPDLKYELENQICYQTMLNPLEKLFDSVELPHTQSDAKQRKYRFLTDMSQQYLDLLEPPTQM